MDVFVSFGTIYSILIMFYFTSSAVRGPISRLSLSTVHIHIKNLRIPLLSMDSYALTQNNVD